MTAPRWLVALLLACPQAALAADAWVEIPGPSYRGKQLVLDAIVRMPEGEGPFPTVVILHGCKGMTEDAEGGWARRFNEMGYATVMVESFRPRGWLESCNINVTAGDRARDAHYTHRWLREQAWFAPGQAVLFGISHGGWGALTAVNGGNFPDETPFRAVIALYPYCGHQVNVLASPTLLLIGNADTLTPKARCETMRINHLEGNEYRYVELDNATHFFDVEMLVTVTVKMPNTDGAVGAPILREVTMRHDAAALATTMQEIRAFLARN